MFYENYVAYDMKSGPQEAQYVGPVEGTAEPQLPAYVCSWIWMNSDFNTCRGGTVLIMNVPVSWNNHLTTWLYSTDKLRVLKQSYNCKRKLNSSNYLYKLSPYVANSIDFEKTGS